MKLSQKGLILQEVHGGPWTHGYQKNKTKINTKLFVASSTSNIELVANELESFLHSEGILCRFFLKKCKIICCLVCSNFANE